MILKERFGRSIALQVSLLLFLILIRWGGVQGCFSSPPWNLRGTLTQDWYFWLDNGFLRWLNFWPFLLIAAIFYQRFWISVFHVWSNCGIYFWLVGLLLVSPWRVNILIHEGWLISFLRVRSSQWDGFDDWHACWMLISCASCFSNLYSTIIGVCALFDPVLLQI